MLLSSAIRLYGVHCALSFASKKEVMKTMRMSINSYEGLTLLVE